MKEARSPHRIISTGSILLVLLLGLTYARPGVAQVNVSKQGDGYVVRNADLTPYRATRTAGKAGGSLWYVGDEAGLSSYATSCDECSADDILCRGGYESDRGSIRGYEDALRYLESRHGAVVKHDGELNGDWISFPEKEDPIGYFFDVITTEKLDGRLLVDYFRWIELPSRGEFGPEGTSLKPPQRQYSFPNDLYYGFQWNLRWTRLSKAQWHPAGARHGVKVAVIDSGVRDERRHAGLDGTRIEHVDVAQSYVDPTPHALGILTLLTDRGQDGDGIVGLLGDQWDDTGCYDGQSFFSSKRPEVRSYNVGDLGPISTEVARAIRRAVHDRVDVINLSLSLAPSPTVEEAIRFALERDVVVVVSAGNYRVAATDRPAKFPATVRGVISVASGGPDRRFSDFSANRGVDVIAPGEGIVLGGPGDTWYYADGTSFAAPHVTATAAMIRSVRPGLSPRWVKLALKLFAQNRHQNQGTGFLSSLSALNLVLPRSDRVRDRHIPFPEECGVGGTFRFAGDVLGDGSSKSALIDNYDATVDAELFAEMDGPFADVPDRISIEGNYPNPFNPSTLVRFQLPRGQHVRLAVFNMLGQEVQVLADEYFAAGVHEVRFEATNLPSGVYVARMATESTTVHRNMILAK